MKPDFSLKSKNDYLNRINRVIDYIENHYADDLNLERIADVACFSPFHFHRIFASMMGEKLSEYIQRVRLEKAAAILLQNPNIAITEVALNSGFASSASFANSFKKHFSESASRFRSKHSHIDYHYITPPREDLDSIKIKMEFSNGETHFCLKGNDYEQKVSVITLPPWKLAYVRYIGPYKGDTRLFQKLWEKLAHWAMPRGLFSHPESQFLALYYDNPEVTAEDKLKVNVCVTLHEDIETSGEIGKMDLPGGLYAKTRFLCGPEDYSKAWGWLYGTWLPLCGYIPDERMAFEWFSKEKTEQRGKQLVDICLPVKAL
ncbi:MAG: AraC family transcriptional regulator [Spirochaetales bacterium]|nr:AraC family transcriptional regulator [Spirochaetales bacterium]